PLQTNIYFLSVVDRAIVLYRKRGETIDISEYSELTRSGTKLLARAWEIEKALQELHGSETPPEVELDPEPIVWRG
ncbi:MAG TPA: hypothetical protein VM598_05085, partial [Bdellovibrionota bacterium]|nr:hypothetical protein [Bdellovibrionota bacterium]